MPNDLYQWEKAGALVHHCPQCFKPLTRPGARKTCIGEHVEACKRYHTQLFKKGTSGQCNPCAAEDKEQTKRHRKIAELLRDLKSMKEVEDPQDSPLTTKNAKESPMTKELRKVTRKGKKAFPKPKKAITTADIEFVTKVLRPHDSEEEEGVLERQLLDDEDVKLNRAYHAGTSNRREIRNEFIKKDKTHSNTSTQQSVDSKEIEGILQVLDVSPVSPDSTNAEKDLHVELRVCIRSDLQQAKKERDEMMMRKAGFWRFANNKVYKRLMENGMIAGEKKNDGSSRPSTPQTPDSSASHGELEDETDETDETTEPETDVATPSEEQEEGGVTIHGLEQLTLSTSEGNTIDDVKTPTSSTLIKAGDDENDEWTAVGKASKIKQTQVGKLTLLHNGGLAKMISPVTNGRKRSGFEMLDEKYVGKDE